MDRRRHLAAWGFTTVVAVGLGVAVASTPPSRPADKLAKQPQTVTGLLATRPAPDLATLGRRSEPDNAGSDATDSFWDILKLRDVGDTKAVPVLKKVLLAQRSPTRIHGFAAAEALFCIGTPDAMAALDTQLLASDYRARMGIMYAFHWEMRPGPRDGFIQRYHLRNLAKDLTVVITAAPMSGSKLPLTVRVTNLAKQAVSLSADSLDQQSLYFQNAQGRIAWTRELGFREHYSTRWITLPPGGKEDVKFTLQVKTLTAGDRPDPSLPVEQKVYLESDGVQFMIGQPGRFKVYALLEAAPLPVESRKLLGAPDGALWTGRAVSEPAVVDIAAPSQKQALGQFAMREAIARPLG